MKTFADGASHREYHTDRAHACKLCDGTGEQKRAWAFPNGSAFMDWKSMNCEECVKGYDESARKWRCELERAVDDACAGDGTISLDVLAKIGANTDGRCVEKEWRPQ